MKDQIGPKAFLERARKNLGRPPSSSRSCRCSPTGCSTVWSGRSLAMRWRSEELERLREESRAYRSQMLAVVGGGALVVSGTLLLVLGPGSMLSAALAEALAVACFIAGGLFLAASWR